MMVNAGVGKLEPGVRHQPHLSKFMMAMGLGIHIRRFTWKSIKRPDLSLVIEKQRPKTVTRNRALPQTKISKACMSLSLYSGFELSDETGTCGVRLPLVTATGAGEKVANQFGTDTLV